MIVITPAGATIPGVTHHQADINGTQLHYVSGRITAVTAAPVRHRVGSTGRAR
jgi:hypothetical protein